jgi:hypothetical protein
MKLTIDQLKRMQVLALHSKTSEVDLRGASADGEIMVLIVDPLIGVASTPLLHITKNGEVASRLAY